MIMEKKALSFGLPAILFFAAVFRCAGFWMPHDEPRELLHASLAMRLDRSGSHEYNLREVGFKWMVFRDNSSQSLVYPIENPPISERAVPAGDILDPAITRLQLYPEPTFFTVSLMMSHRWLTELMQPYTLVQTTRGYEKRGILKGLFFKYQVWAVFLPFAASLLTVLFTYFLASRMFGVSVGVLSALFLSVNPFEILNAAKVNPESYFALWTVLSFWILWEAVRRKSPWGCFWAGLFFALALLTKKEGWVLLFAVWGLCVMAEKKDSLERSFIRILFSWKFIGFLAGVYLLAADWVWQLCKVYDNPWIPIMIADRFLISFCSPPAFIFENSGTVLLQVILAWPFSVFALGTLEKIEKDHAVLFLWLWALLVFLLLIWNHGIARIHLAAAFFPAMAILSAQGIVKLKSWTEMRTKSRRVTLAFVCVIVLFVGLSLKAAWTGMVGA